MSDRIIKYLLDKKDHQDDLEGITLFVYENEVKELSGEVMNAIGILLSKGLLKECENSDGKKCLPAFGYPFYKVEYPL